jgi:hypothetical protein
MDRYLDCVTVNEPDAPAGDLREMVRMDMAIANSHADCAQASRASN